MFHKTSKNKENKVMKKPREMIADMVSRATDPSGNNTDPQGSYTGAPSNRSEKPVQDADDL